MVAAAMKHLALNFTKLDKFKGVNFRRWQGKMHFWLFSMSVVYVLTTLVPKDGGDNPTVEQVRKRAKWDNDDYVCRGLILNGVNVGDKANSLGTNGSVDGSSDSLKALMSTSKLNDSILWHARLGHIHFKRMQDMSKDGVPNRRNKITPYELWTKRKPNLNYLRVWGCRAVVRLPDPKLKTLEAINDDIDSIMGNNTWALAGLPPGCKWIFKRKLKMDVKTSFLNGELEEEVYINQPKGFIMSGNENKDTGEADVILGIRIKHESNGIAISQSYYIEKVLKKFNYFECTPVSTPIDTSKKLMPNNGHVMSQLEYSKVIGCLMYAMTCTRPDIAFVVGKLSGYTSNSGTQHWQAFQRVLKYLKKTMDYRLTYTGYPSMLEAVGKEAEWLKNLLLEISLWSKPIAPISIRFDSAATLAKAYSQKYNMKSIHLGRDIRCRHPGGVHTPFCPGFLEGTPMMGTHGFSLLPECSWRGHLRWRWVVVKFSGVIRGEGSGDGCCGVRWWGRWWQQWCGRGGSGGGTVGQRVGASDIVDRVDREVRKLFGFVGKSPPEKFSGGGSVVAVVAGRRWRGFVCVY
uniref:GAG-pre-integrase domain-containing protein n=1 Tax=Tanacetum cinerariifolium TaxID=118510 RepID=A0A6L2J718_TANCI|nr:hypothetical protein [Tanacetum cinerariifolium]